MSVWIESAEPDTLINLDRCHRIDRLESPPDSGTWHVVATTEISHECSDEYTLYEGTSNEARAWLNRLRDKLRADEPEV